MSSPASTPLPHCWATFDWRLWWITPEERSTRKTASGLPEHLWGKCRRWSERLSSCLCCTLKLAHAICVPHPVRSASPARSPPGLLYSSSPYKDKGTKRTKQQQTKKTQQQHNKKYKQKQMCQKLSATQEYHAQSVPRVELTMLRFTWEVAPLGAASKLRSSGAMCPQVPAMPFLYHSCPSRSSCTSPPSTYEL